MFASADVLDLIVILFGCALLVVVIACAVEAERESAIYELPPQRQERAHKAWRVR